MIALPTIPFVKYITYIIHQGILVRLPFLRSVAVIISASAKIIRCFKKMIRLGGDRELAD
jgi:hypothetical protein